MKICKICKKEFKPSKRFKSFCSEECIPYNKRRIKKEEIPKYLCNEIECKICGKNFYSRITAKHLLEHAIDSKAYKSRYQSSLYSERLLWQIAATSKGRVMPEGTKEKARQAFLLNNPMSKKECRDKLSISLKGRKNTWGWKLVGVPKTFEHKKKISESKLMYYRSEEGQKFLLDLQNKTVSELNAVLIQVLVDVGLWDKYHFSHEKFVTIKSQPYALDIASEKLKFGIEIDGCFWHKCELHRGWEKAEGLIRENIERKYVKDRILDREIKNVGWSLIRFWGHDITKNLTSCVIRVIEEIERKMNYFEEEENLKKNIVVDYDIVKNNLKGWVREIFLSKRSWGHRLILGKYKRSEWENLDKNDLEKWKEEIFRYYRDRAFPFPFYKTETLERDFKRLLEDTKDLGKDRITLPDRDFGMRVIENFMWNLWSMKVKGSRYSTKEFFEDDQGLKKLIENRIEYSDTISDASMRRGLKFLVGVPGVYSLRLVKFVVSLFRNAVEDFKVLDPCAGFGSRMLGVLSVGGGIKYIGIEPVKETFLNLVRMKDFLKLEGAGLHNCEMEKFESLQKEIDLIYTSPPFYDKEIYDENLQSQFKNYADWKMRFLKVLIDKYAGFLKKEGVMALHMKDVNGISLVLDTKKLMEDIGLKVNLIKVERGEKGERVKLPRLPIKDLGYLVVGKFEGIKC